MIEAKHPCDAPAALLQASERVLSIAAGIFTAGQSRGEVVPGDPARIGLVEYAAVKGLIAVSTNGRFKKIPVDALVGEVIERLIVRLRPRR